MLGSPTPTVQVNRCSCRPLDTTYSVAMTPSQLRMSQNCQRDQLPPQPQMPHWSMYEPVREREQFFTESLSLTPQYTLAGRQQRPAYSEGQQLRSLSFATHEVPVTPRRSTQHGDGTAISGYVAVAGSQVHDPFPSRYHENQLDAYTFLLDDFDFDPQFYTTYVGGSTEITQQLPQQQTDPSNIPHMVEGTGWGCHRYPQTTSNNAASLNADITTAGTPPSAASSISRRPQRTGAQLQDPSLPSQCPECHNTYPTDSDLQRHLRNHIRGTHSCTECDRAFLFPKDLRRHMRTHNRLPPVICNACGKRFDGGRIDNLTRHMMRNHPGIAIPELDTVMAQRALSTYTIP